MADMNRKDIVRLGIDLYHNRVSGNYSIDQANEVLNKALVELNGGKNRLDMRDIRAGRCNELFAVIEEVIMDVKNDIIANDPFFTTFVDYRNVAWGDKPEFYLPDEDMFIVSNIGGGSQAIRRQRVVGGTPVVPTMTWKAIRIYEEIELILSGRVDWAAAIERVARSFVANMVVDIYAAYSSALLGVTAPYAVSGSFTEANMLTMIQHVRAANFSREAYIMGSLIGLNKVVASHDTAAQVALESKYYNGFVGYFNGVPKVEMMQYHKPGTTTFALSDNIVTVLPVGEFKPIKYVTEGNSLIVDRSFRDNMDMTEEYMMLEKTGIAVTIPAGAGKVGMYNINA